MLSLTSRVWSFHAICPRNTKWLSYLIKVLRTRQFFSVILLTTPWRQTLLFAIKSAHSSSWTIRLLRDLLVDGIFGRAGFLILFVEALDSGIKKFINRVLFTLKIIFKLVDLYHKWSKAWLRSFLLTNLIHIRYCGFPSNLKQNLTIKYLFTIISHKQTISLKQ